MRRGDSERAARHFRIGDSSPSKTLRDCAAKAGHLKSATGDGGAIGALGCPEMPNFRSPHEITLRKAPEFRGFSSGDQRLPNYPDCVAGGERISNSDVLNVFVCLSEIAT